MRTGMRKLKAVFGGSEKGEHLRGIVSIPGVQVVESHEELYRTVRKLGSGITATVHEGVGRADGVRYALKHFSHASLRGDDEAVDLFRTEVEVLRKSGSHRFVVSLHDVLSTPLAAIMVMELVTGGDLMSPIERQGGGPYSERRAQHIFAQMTLAVCKLRPPHLRLRTSSYRPLRLRKTSACARALSTRPHLSTWPQHEAPPPLVPPRDRACAEPAPEPCTYARAQVRHLHSLGIVHRDLKPENVCFTTAEQRC